MCEEKKSWGSAKWLHLVSLIFRIAGIALAAAAAAIMATESHFTVYADYGWRPRTVTYTDFPAFVYLVAATSIAAVLEAVAVILSLIIKKKAARVLMPLLGALVPALLYTSAGAAFAAGWDDVSYCLEPSGRRFSVCRSGRVGRRFCEEVHESMWLALAAGVAVSIAEWLTTFWWSRGGGAVVSVSISGCLAALRWCCCCGGGDGSDCDSDSDSESVCGHGCHSKH